MRTPAPTLTVAQLVQLRDATLYSYESGDYPPDAPKWLTDYATPDGGLINVIDQLITTLRATGDALDLVQGVNDMYRHLVMDTPKDQDIHSDVVDTADLAITAARTHLENRS